MTTLIDEFVTDELWTLGVGRSGDRAEEATRREGCCYSPQRPAECPPACGFDGGAAVLRAPHRLLGLT